MDNSILRIKSVTARTGLPRSTLYLRIFQNKFPKPSSLGGSTVGWISSEVNAWIEEKIEAREQVEV